MRVDWLFIPLQSIGLMVFVSMSVGIISEALIDRDTTSESTATGVIATCIVAVVNLVYSRFKLNSNIGIGRILLSAVFGWLLTYITFVIMFGLTLLAFSSMNESLENGDWALASGITMVWFPIWIAFILAPEFTVWWFRRNDSYSDVA